MDPHETYRLLREHLAYLSSHQPDRTGDGDIWADHARAVVELFGDLDRWLSYGGFRPTAWNPTAHVPELDGQIGFVRGDEIRSGDVLLFPAREVSAVDASALTIQASTSSGTENLDASQLVLVLRPSDTARQHATAETCPQCGAEPGEACEPGCLALVSADDMTWTRLASLGLIMDDH